MFMLGLHGVLCGQCPPLHMSNCVHTVRIIIVCISMYCYSTYMLCRVLDTYSECWKIDWRMECWSLLYRNTYCDNCVCVYIHVVHDVCTTLFVYNLLIYCIIYQTHTVHLCTNVSLGHPFNSSVGGLRGHHIFPTHWGRWHHLALQLHSSVAS